MEYCEICQDPDLTDSDMMDIIREKVQDGFSLCNYKWEDGIKTYTFER